MINDRYNGLNFLQNENTKQNVRFEIETINDQEHHGENNNLHKQCQERVEIYAATCYESLIVRRIQQLRPWR